MRTPVTAVTLTDVFIKTVIGVSEDEPSMFGSVCVNVVFKPVYLSDV